MAIKNAVATGNWSNPAIWNGGTLPGAGDYVYCNGFVVTIDQDITVAALRNDARDGFSASGAGYFNLPTTGGTLRTINAALEGFNGNAAQPTIVKVPAPTLPCNLVWNGDIIPNYLGTVATNGLFDAGNVTMSGVFTLNGDVHTNTGTSGTSYAVVRVVGTASAPYLTFNFNGDVVVSPQTTTSVGRGVLATNCTAVWNGRVVLQSGGASTSSSLGFQWTAAGGVPLALTVDTGGHPLIRPPSATSTGFIGITGGIGHVLTASLFDGSNGALIDYDLTTGSSYSMTLNGPITLGTSNVASGRTVSISGTGTLITIVINGNLTRSSLTGATSACPLYVNASVCNVTVNGNILPGGYGQGIQASFSNSASTLTVNGDVAYGDGDTAYAIRMTNGAYVTPVVVNGTVDCSRPTNHNANGAVVFTDTLAVTLGSIPALLRCTNVVLSPYSIYPSNRGFYMSNTGTVTTPTTPSGAASSMSGNATGPYPAATDVRQGVSYGASLTGTLAVPPAATVNLGVPVGQVTGTHQCPGSVGGLTG